MAAATLDDFRRVSTNIVDDALRNLYSERAGIDGQFSRHGRLNSGAHRHEAIRTAEAAFIRALNALCSKGIMFAQNEGIGLNLLEPVISAEADRMIELTGGRLHFRGSEKELSATAAFTSGMRSRLRSSLADLMIGYVGGDRVMPRRLTLPEQRLQLLKRAYDVSEGDTNYGMLAVGIADEVNIPARDAKPIVNYLCEKGLLRRTNVQGKIEITALGVDMVEKALSHPEEPTEYLPAINYVMQVGTMIGSQVMQGSPGATQNISVAADVKLNVEALVSDLLRDADRLGVSSTTLEDLKADLETIRSQLSASRPKKSVIFECLSTVRNIVEGATGSVLASEYLPKINDALAALGAS